MKKDVSTTIRLIFQAQDRTLTKKEVKEEMEKLKEVIEKRGWKVR